MVPGEVGITGQHVPLLAVVELKSGLVNVTTLLQVDQELNVRQMLIMTGKRPKPAMW